MAGGTAHVRVAGDLVFGHFQAALCGWDVLWNLVQPLVESDVVRVGEAAAGVDTVEEGLSLVVGRYPGTIGVRDLIVDLGEWAPGCPADEGAGFPVQSG